MTGSLYIHDMLDATNLASLSNLRAVGQSLFIVSNDALKSVQGLEQLESVGLGLQIAYNDKLRSLQGLSGLTQVNANEELFWENAHPLEIHDNVRLPACWAEQLEVQTGENCTEYNSTIEHGELRRQRRARHV